MLRDERRQLKGCQLQYFTFSVAGTAGIFGWAATCGERTAAAVPGLAFLAPLVILLPCWWIFFDKATTITRIVGYYRVVERMLAEYPNAGVDFLGYERALELYRWEDDGTGRLDMEGCPTVKKLRAVRSNVAGPAESVEQAARYRYWHVNWRMFLVLSVICCVGAVAFLITGGAILLWLIAPIAAFLAVVYALASTLRVLGQVTGHGRYSYFENHCFWEYIHYAATQGRYS
jgi:hypothetical protein